MDYYDLRDTLCDRTTACLLWMVKKINRCKDDRLAYSLVQLAKNYARRPDDITGP